MGRDGGLGSAQIWTTGGPHSLGNQSIKASTGGWWAWAEAHPCLPQGTRRAWRLPLFASSLPPASDSTAVLLHTAMHTHCCVHVAPVEHAHTHTLPVRLSSAHCSQTQPLAPAPSSPSSSPGHDAYTHIHTPYPKALFDPEA